MRFRKLGLGKERVQTYCSLCGQYTLIVSFTMALWGDRKEGCLITGDGGL